MQKYTVAGQTITDRVALHLWAILCTRYQDDNGSGVTLNTENALAALVEIGKLLKRKRSAILKGILKRFMRR